AGGEDFADWLGLEDLDGCAEDWDTIGGGGRDVLEAWDRAGLRNMFGETRAAADGADEEPVPRLGSGVDDADAGEAATTPAPASSWRAVGRSRGCLARQLATSERSSPGTLSRSAWLLTSRYMSAACDPAPNGPVPVAAKVRTEPRLKMSLAGPMSAPRTCSGDMYPGEPISTFAPATTLASAASEIPKSMTRGPSSASRTLEGFRSRCTTPAAWMASRPSASPAVSASTLLAGSGPWPFTASVSDGPATYAVASHGIGQSRSASTTSAVNRPLTFCGAASSRRKRALKSGSAARSVRMTLTAIGRPPADMPRKSS